MFIDESYFKGALTIAQLGKQDVVNRLTDFINSFEPQVLEAALGYDFYQLFIEGLDVGSDEITEQRWLNLLNGVAFTDVNQVRKKWIGFAGGANTQTTIAIQREPLTIYAGTTPGFPTADYQYTNTDLAAWEYDLESFGVGTLEWGVDWNYKTGGGWVLTNTAYRTQPGERFVMHFTGKRIAVVQSGGTNNLSPLAGIIYYEYMQDLASQNTGIGLVKSEGTNALNAGLASGKKPVAAFNNAVTQIRVLWELFKADANLPVPVYPEFKSEQVYGYYGWYNGCSTGYSLKYKNNYGI